MKKWVKWMLVLCMVFGLTLSAQAEEITEEVVEEVSEEGSNESVEIPTEEEEEEETLSLQKPVLSLIQNEKGVYLSWDAVEGATRYELYRKTADESWSDKPYVITKGRSFTNTAIKYGVKYYYKIKATNTEAGVQSDFSKIQVRTVRVPKVANLVVEGDTYSSMKITWDKSSPATGYEIYRATSKNGTYKKIKTVTKSTTTSYIDKGVVLGKTYYYKVRAVYSTNKGSFCESVSGQVALIPPVMKKGSFVTAKSVKILWNEAPGAQGYRILRRAEGDVWKEIAKVSGASTTSYTDKTATGKYEYSVRSYRVVDGTTYKSNRANPVHARVLKTPSTKLTQIDGEKAIKLSWEKVSYVTGYKIYQKIGTNGSWNCVATVAKDKQEYVAKIPVEQRQYWKLRPIYAKESEYSYGAYAEEQTVKIYRPKFVTYLDLNYSAMPSNTKTEALLLGVINVGYSNMRIYSENAYYQADAENGRDVYLADVDTGNAKKYIDVAVKSGEITEDDIAVPLFIVEGESTTFDKDSEIQFVFRYDGLYYRAYVSYDSVDFEEIEKP